MHDLTKFQLSKLDALTTKTLKSWLSLPRCATTAVLYDPLSLGIPTVSSLYAECHALSLAKLSLSNDPKVLSAVSTKLSIES